MKKIILTISVLFVIGFSANCEDKDLVAKKYKGQINIENQRHEKAMKKIYNSMLKDYETLLKKYIKYSKLEEASEIKKKIEELQAKLETISESKKTMKLDLSSFAGVYRYENVRGPQMTISKDKTVTKQSGRHRHSGTWKISEDKIIITWKDGEYDTWTQKGNAWYHDEHVSMKGKKKIDSKLKKVYDVPEEK